MNMKFIPLTQGYKAMIDDEDYERVMKYRIYAIQGTSTVYGLVSQIRIYLHNFINPPPEGFTVDHIDRNGLNCQKENLRFATKSQQVINRKSNNKSGYRGIYLFRNKWRAMIQYQNARHYGGSYKNEIDAAKAYDELAKKLHGDFAMLNFPEGQ